MYQCITSNVNACANVLKEVNTRFTLLLTVFLATQGDIDNYINHTGSCQGDTCIESPKTYTKLVNIEVSTKKEP